MLRTVGEVNHVVWIGYRTQRGLLRVRRVDVVEGHVDGLGADDVEIIVAEGILAIEASHVDSQGKRVYVGLKAESETRVVGVQVYDRAASPMACSRLGCWTSTGESSVHAGVLFFKLVLTDMRQELESKQIGARTS